MHDEQEATHDEQEAGSHASADAHAEAAEHDGGHEGGDHGPLPPVWLILPFLGLLVMIATGPLFYAHHWHHHYPKYTAGLGAIVVIYYLFVLESSVPMMHALAEYLSFIALIASLFIAASGIFLSLNARGTPWTNSVLLFVGSVLANLIATTGAAMLFIRPYMRP